MNDGHPSPPVLTPKAIAARCGIQLLDELAAGDIDTAADFLLVHDTTAGTRKKYKPAGLTTALNLVTAASAFATDNRMMRSDGTGRGAQASVITVDDSGNLSGAASVVIGTDPTGSELLRVGGGIKASADVLVGTDIKWDTSLTAGLRLGPTAAPAYVRYNTNGNLDIIPRSGYVIDAQGPLTVSGVTKVTSTTDATSATDTSASLNTAGGLAVAKRIFAGTGINTGAYVAVSHATNPYLLLVAGTTEYYLQILSGKWNFSYGVVTINDATDATDKDTASLVTEGGIAAEQSIFAGGDLQCSGVLKIDGTQVVKEQQAAVADATGAGDVVAQLNTLLARCRAHGLIAT